ncbi:hypothetical protein C7T94_09360 [Pedobacter yulinensis]|uniref:DUF3606 domain-containing protein n=1 Tax=Pedobacter yulinensis TaxID=2126353 RepID=A0A2T3HK70_9SPHI|nr:DUF3606 domain-containing protein [Pedobacter yulinensis]PST82837.1 hypothetical protein C7T94_09360 [Pedobacter yulinensis]
MKTSVRDTRRAPEMVDISDETARQYWSRRLKVSEETLKSAVRAIHQLEFSKLEAYLKNTRFLSRLNGSANLGGH